jgi:hypothetical protein
VAGAAAAEDGDVDGHVGGEGEKRTTDERGWTRMEMGKRREIGDLRLEIWG